VIEIREVYGYRRRYGRNGYMERDRDLVGIE